MKKVSKIVLSVCMALACVLSFAACGKNTNNGPTKTAGIGTAIYSQAGHGKCVTEATVVVDGYGNPTKVTIDEIFSLKDVCSYKATDAQGTKDENAYVLDANAPVVTVTTGEGASATYANYYQYVQIGNAVFQADANGKYNQIGVENGIQDFQAYYENTQSSAGVEMYYNAYLNNQLKVLTPAAQDTPKAVKVGENYYLVKAFNTSNGSMRKRLSKYWSANANGGISQSSGLGFNGNMDALENYLLVNGFSAISESLKKTDLPAGTGGYLTLNGVNTGATASDSYLYLITAYKAYNNALANRKDIK